MKPTEPERTATKENRRGNLSFLSFLQIADASFQQRAHDK
jgi:hypothetical protein